MALGWKSGSLTSSGALTPTASSSAAGSWLQPLHLFTAAQLRVWYIGWMNGDG